MHAVSRFVIEEYLSIYKVNELGNDMKTERILFINAACAILLISLHEFSLI